MRVFELAQKKNMESFTPDQQKFLSKLIIRNVKRIAVENDMPENEAYYWYMHGLYGGDDEIVFDK